MSALVLIASVLGAATSSAANTAPQSSNGTSTITVSRPAGRVVLSDISFDSNGALHATVTDTRADDPGWTVTVSGAASADWTPFVGDHTSGFADGHGGVYAQEVAAGQPESATLASAPPHHGLGIAHLGAKLDLSHGAVITITVA